VDHAKRNSSTVVHVMTNRVTVNQQHEHSGSCKEKQEPSAGGHSKEKRSTVCHAKRNSTAGHVKRKSTAAHSKRNRSTEGHVMINRVTVSHAKRNKDTMGHAMRNRYTASHAKRNRSTLVMQRNVGA
jgi:hypothetical protein